MAFTPEDGTGLAGANSFVDVAYADAYFTLHGNAAWAGTDAEKQAWLVQATRYITTAFGSRLTCYTLLNADQALPFPTVETEMPAAVQEATCEYAVRAKVAPLMPDPVVDATGFSVVTTKKKVGPIEKEFSIAGGSSQPALYRSYPYPDSLMRSLLCLGTGGTRVIR